MKALKIRFNQEEYILGVENGLTSFSVVIKNEDERNEAWAQFSSLEKKTLKHIYFEDYINTGDTFSLLIMENVEASKISKPTEKIDKSEDSNKELVLQSKLKSYYRLKEELEEKGLI